MIYNQSGTPETTCSGSWGAWDYNCTTNTKSRTSSCGCSESASMSSSEVSSQCPSACDDATIVYGVESSTGKGMVSYWGTIRNDTTGYSVYANVNDEVSTTVGSETVEAGVTYYFSADEGGSVRCNTSESATGTSTGLGLSSVTPDCGETVYIYVVANDICQ